MTDLSRCTEGRFIVFLTGSVEVLEYKNSRAGGQGYLISHLQDSNVFNTFIAALFVISNQMSDLFVG
jgi:hypothetical protein